jgi:hypothetical protein
MSKAVEIIATVAKDETPHTRSDTELLNLTKIHQMN